MNYSSSKLIWFQNWPNRVYGVILQVIHNMIKIILACIILQALTILISARNDKGIIKQFWANSNNIVLMKCNCIGLGYCCIWGDPEQSPPPLPDLLGYHTLTAHYANTILVPSLFKHKISIVSFTDDCSLSMQYIFNRIRFSQQNVSCIYYPYIMCKITILRTIPIMNELLAYFFYFL